MKQSDLDRGHERLSGETPNSGENIMHPEHLARRQMYSMMDPDEKAENVGGFLERELPQPYERPNRSEEQDLG